MPTIPDSLNLRSLQVDASATEPFDEPLNPLSDAAKIGALFFVEPGEDNKEVGLWRDGDDFRFRDVSNPGTGGEGVTLTDLLSGSSGVTESSHKALRQLIHFIDSGPANGFATGAKFRMTPIGPFPTSYIWYSDNTHTTKIVELTVTRNSQKLPTSEEWKMYAADGTTVVATVTDTISYTGIFESDRSRDIP
jgi:hypothetical protein